MGTIVNPIGREEVEQLARQAGAVDVRFFPMRHQGDRYMMMCRAPGSMTAAQAPVTRNVKKRSDTGAPGT